MLCYSAVSRSHQALFPHTPRSVGSRDQNTFQSEAYVDGFDSVIIITADGMMAGWLTERSD